MAMRKSSVNTGVSGLDNKIKGLCGADLMVLAARPSMGKTSLALNIIANIVLAKKPRPVLLFSLAMNRHQIMMRFIASEAEVGIQSLRTGSFQRNRWSDITGAAARLSEAPLYINDAEKVLESHSREVLHETMDQIEILCHSRGEWGRLNAAKPGPCVTVPHIRTISRRLITQLRKKNEKLGVIVIDYVQLIRGASRSLNRRQQLSGISRSLKRLARDLSVPVIVLSQVGRAAEEKGRDDARPRISDMVEAGSLGQDADILAFIYREEYYNPVKSSLSGRAEIIVAKNPRGEMGTVKMNFKREQGSFY